MKEQYINMRNRKVIDLSVLYTFAREQGMTLDFNQFTIGAQFLNFEVLIEDLDRKFGLTRLHDKNDNFIKVIE
jgi:hypothetical protein